MPSEVCNVVDALLALLVSPPPPPLLKFSSNPAIIALNAAVNPGKFPASPYREYTGFPASLKMKKCFRRESHFGSVSVKVGKLRSGFQLQNGFDGLELEVVSLSPRRNPAVDDRPAITGSQDAQCREQCESTSHDKSSAEPKSENAVVAVASEK